MCEGKKKCNRCKKAHIKKKHSYIKKVHPKKVKKIKK